MEGPDGTARKIDFVVRRKDESWTPVEVTSKMASKFEKLSKEMDIRDAGGRFVRDPQTKELIEISGISKIMTVM